MIISKSIPAKKISIPLIAYCPYSVINHLMPVSVLIVAVVCVAC